MSTPTVERFRHHPGRAVAGLVVAVSTVTLAGFSGWLLLASLPPLAWSIWAWRAGTDADRQGIRVRALLAARHVPWSAVHQVAAVGRDRVVATLRDGARLSLTAVTAADLPRLVAAGGGMDADASGVPDGVPGTSSPVIV
jgi:hypothetical protein